MFVLNCRSFEASHIPYCLCIQQAKQVKDLINFSAVGAGCWSCRMYRQIFWWHLVAGGCTGFVVVVVYVDEVNIIT